MEDALDDGGEPQGQDAGEEAAAQGKGLADEQVLGGEGEFHQFKGADHGQVDDADDDAGLDQGAALAAVLHSPDPDDAGAHHIKKEGEGLLHEERGEGGAQESHTHPGFQPQEEGGEDGGQAQGQKINQILPHLRADAGDRLSQAEEGLMHQETDQNQDGEENQVPEAVGELL